MKKTGIALLLIVAVICIGTAVAGAADYKTAIVGNWKFDLGGGFMATCEYKANGTFVQKVKDMNIAGTYTVRGNALTMVSGGKTTAFTIVKAEGNTMTVKRNSDGKTLVYTKV
jgi:hypothetical protein